MHAANVDRSVRLNKVLGILASGAWVGTREIVRAADVCAVNSIISEIRANGIKVNCRCVGRGRYEYSLPCRAQPEQLALIAA